MRPSPLNRGRGIPPLPSPQRKGTPLNRGRGLPPLPLQQRKGTLPPLLSKGTPLSRGRDFTSPSKEGYSPEQGPSCTSPSVEGYTLNRVRAAFRSWTKALLYSSWFEIKIVQNGYYTLISTKRPRSDLFDEDDCTSASDPMKQIHLPTPFINMKSVHRYTRTRLGTMPEVWFWGERGTKLVMLDI